MKLVFLGLFFSEASLAAAYENCKHGVQMAPHLFQSRLTEGFHALDDVDLTVLNVPPVGSFPMNYRKLRVPDRVWKSGEEIGYLDLPLVKRAEQRCKLRKKIRAIIKREPDCHFLIYHLYEPFITVMSEMKRKYPGIHVTLIETDPVFGRGGITNTPREKRLGDRLVARTKCFDDFVILSPYLADTLEIGERPKVIVECICDANQPAAARKERSDGIFLYTGVTSAIYGFHNLVQAFEQVPEAQLWICGYGECDAYIREEAKTHPNIRHFGYLDQSAVQKLRDQCDFLINPRTPTGTYTKYSFPSKTAEYLLSGKPAVMYRLEAIPPEYDAYLNYLTAQDANGIADEIRALLRSDYGELTAKAAAAAEFMRANKTAPMQAEKIAAMLRGN